MKRRTFIQSLATGAITLVGFNSRIELAAEASGSLEAAFRQPPPDAHAKTWWHWMNGNVTAEGITLDLEAMKRVGIRGFQIFQVGTGIPKGPVDYSGAEHARLLQHAADEAGRLGLEFGIMNCPGWSSSGGPWITPELSMKQFTWSETLVQGGRQVALTLPQPFTQLGYYRDAYVLAFPALEGESSPWQQSLRGALTNSGTVDVSVLSGAGQQSGMDIRPDAAGQNGYLELEFSAPFAARSIAYYGNQLPVPPSRHDDPLPNWLEASDDGTQFHKVCDIDWGAAQEDSLEFPASASFPPTRARFFRIVCTSSVSIHDVRLSGAFRIPHWTRQANFTRVPAFEVDPGEVPVGSIIDPSKVLDITHHMDEHGELHWDAPEGTWTVLRMGQTTTGSQNLPAPDGGLGLECDKFSGAAYDFHFDHFFQGLLEALAPLAARGLAGAMIDSYETGMQNWTQEFPAEFQKRRGYDLRHYLPAMTGRVVQIAQVSERFLWDLRRTCADLMADNYYGRFAERCRQHQMKAYAEPYSSAEPRDGPFEELQSGAQLDVPVGEFWAGQGDLAIAYSVKLAGSVGHLFGKRIVGAESFTGSKLFTMWQNYPYQMKGQGDLMYTQGVNEFIFHRNAMQPHPTAVPGMTMGENGWECERTNTIYAGLAGWLQYAARSQNMLRQGTLVADLVYYAGVDVPVETPVHPHQLVPTPPEGYYYDVANEEAILTRMKAVDGRIVLPDGPSPAEGSPGHEARDALRPAGGMGYRVLVLPPDQRLSLEVLRKVRDMVRDGVAVVGPKPEINPGLSGYPDSDSELRRIADEVWGDLDGSAKMERSYGKGRVFWGLTLAEVFEKLGLPPDCDITSRSADAPINFIHRRADGADLYFVANRRRRAEDLVCTFRVKDKQPELWNAESGAIAPINIFEQTDTGIRVPLQLGPAESVFVVFRSPAPARRFKAIVKNGKTVLGTTPFPAFPAGGQREVTNNFTLSAWAKPDLYLILPPQGHHSEVTPRVSFVVAPAQGDALYGTNHASCGLAVGRNGVVVIERTKRDWFTVLSVAMPIAGWVHLALAYKDGGPSLYVDGKLVGHVEPAGGRFIHPGLNDARQRDGVEYFDGDMSDPELFRESLGEDRIRQLAAAGGPHPIEPPDMEWAAGSSPELTFWTKGNYALVGATGNTNLDLGELADPVRLSGPWEVNFPANLGAPPQVVLPALIPLNQHPSPGVKYFSGTATYHKQFSIDAAATAKGRRLYLDLGWVYIIAQIRVNDRDLGLLWKPPFRVDITDAIRPGENILSVLVTNQWVNRLIGDEQLPSENEYDAAGAIKAIPEWYLQGKPKPAGGRITFTTWKHYDQDSPLLCSGLAGPVLLRTALRRRLA